ncbi:MAG TPA: hypothetical protein PLV92_30180, partial [Pirellulaceae bacterium]|nr:hypothetical protein [Pirellulaceae bacterium]
MQAISASRQSEPAKLTNMIRGDLDWIVMKALDKERGRRYESASAFAKDVERHLADEMIEACPPTAGYRLRKFARQNRTALTASALIALALLAGIATSSWLALRARTAERAALAYARLAKTAEAAAEDKRTAAESQAVELAEQRQAAERLRSQAEQQRLEAERQQQEAQTQRDEAERQRSVAQPEKSAAQQHAVTSQLALGTIANMNGDTAGALSWYLQAYRNSPPSDPRRISARSLIGAWGDGLKQTLVHDSGVHAVAISADGRKLVTGYYNSRAQIWDLATGMPEGKPLSLYGDMVSAQLSADGSLALIGDWAGAKVWDVATGKLRYPI